VGTKSDVNTGEEKISCQCQGAALPYENNLEEGCIPKGIHLLLEIHLVFCTPNLLFPSHTFLVLSSIVSVV
jgi:hypothetical protein